MTLVFIERQVDNESKCMSVSEIKRFFFVLQYRNLIFSSRNSIDNHYIAICNNILNKPSLYISHQLSNLIDSYLLHYKLKK